MKTLALEHAIIKRLLEQEQEEPVSIQPNSTIYVDMDGVVVDFHTPMIGEINSILDAGLPDFLQGSKTSRRALRKIKKQMGEEYRVGTKADLHNPLIRDLTFSIIKRKPYDYFVNLGQMKDGVEMLWPYVTSLPHRIEMLTASVQGLDPDKKTAEDAKKDWVATHLDPQPAAVNVVMGAARKIPYATSNGVPNVLIDDRSDTIAKWNEAGGIGILHTTGNSASTARRLKDILNSKILQEQISFKDVKEVLQQPEFWMYYLDKVEFVPYASAIAGPINAALKKKHGDNVGAIASASSVVPFYKAVKSLSNVYTLAQKSLISVAQEAGVDVSEIEVKALLDRRKDVEDDLLASMTPQDRARAIEDQYKGRDGMSAEEYDEYLKDMDAIDDIKGEAAKRKPRKKGQKRKSSKHSDLYTDEDPKGTIHGLGFKDAATARKGRAIINKARRTHAHKVQAALVMKQRAKVAKVRTKDPEKKKNLNAAYKVWSEFLEKLKAKTKKMKKERVDEKKRKHPRYRPPRKDPKTGKYDNPCGKGFKPGAQTGVLTKIGPQSGRRVSNCEPIKKKKNEAVLEAVIKRLLNED